MYKHGYIRLDAVPYHIGDLQHSLIRIINTNHSSLIIDSYQYLASIAICKGHYFFSDIFHNNCFQFNNFTFFAIHISTPWTARTNI